MRQHNEDWCEEWMSNYEDASQDMINAEDVKIESYDNNLSSYNRSDGKGGVGEVDKERYDRNHEDASNDVVVIEDQDGSIEYYNNNLALPIYRRGGNCPRKTKAIALSIMSGDVEPKRISTANPLYVQHNVEFMIDKRNFQVKNTHCSFPNFTSITVSTKYVMTPSMNVRG